MNSLRSCMRDRIRDVIVERTLDGTYPSGMRLKELALAAEFQVSQAPIREALRELEALGLVQSERYRGTRVRPADLRELREAYELRALIEERSAQLAVPCAPQVLQDLRRHLGAMQRAVRARNGREHASAAAAFHHTLVVASGNAMFVRVWEAMHWEVRIRVAMQQRRQRGLKPDALVKAHGAVVRALEGGDGAGAGKRLRKMIGNILQGLEPPEAPTRGKRAGSGSHVRQTPARARSFSLSSHKRST